MAKASSKPANMQGRNNQTDAIALLTADHRAVTGLFKEFEELTKQAANGEQKGRLVRQICTDLRVHAQVEEEVFYPAVREAIDDDALMDEAEVEHASAREIIAQLEAMQPGDDHYDARVTVLGEQIEHHVKEEEGEMFAKARKADVNTLELGAEMAARKEALKDELGADEEDASAARLTDPESRKARENRK